MVAAAIPLLAPAAVDPAVAVDVLLFVSILHSALQGSHMLLDELGATLSRCPSSCLLYTSDAADE